MSRIHEEISERISILVGLELSGITCAADMLMLQFGPLTPVRNRKGAVKHVGKWALHIQCPWQIECTGCVLASQADLRGSDGQAAHVVDKLGELIRVHGLHIVEAARVTEWGDVDLLLSASVRILTTPAHVADAEDWRLFAPGKNEHFVFEGGKIV
jgi:hypothetical protein